MIEVNRTGPFESAVIAVVSTSYPNVFVGVTGMGETGAEVALLRLCEDDVYRAYRETTYATEGARMLSLPPGSYKVRITGGPVTVEVKTL